MLKMRSGFMLSFVLVCVLLIILSTSLLGYGGSDNSSIPPIQPTDPDALNSNGIRNEVQAYIDTVYPNSAKKKKALESYAQKLQYACTKVTTKEEALNFHPQIIRSLSCIFKLGEEHSPDSPSRIVGRKTVNPPDGIEAWLRYGNFLAGKAFTVSSPGDTAETVCDFDLNSLPN